mmetsp:Transcript_4626/g.9935  ORF Transcript_4626/g.9935 Transcript_4626/m.9935 type:complete len:202 (-) Transcript_4626:2218-2823(-)
MRQTERPASRRLRRLEDPVGRNLRSGLGSSGGVGLVGSHQLNGPIEVGSRGRRTRALNRNSLEDTEYFEVNATRCLHHSLLVERGLRVAAGLEAAARQAKSRLIASAVRIATLALGVALAFLVALALIRPFALRATTAATTADRDGHVACRHTASGREARAHLHKRARLHGPAAHHRATADGLCLLQVGCLLRLDRDQRSR